MIKRFSLTRAAAFLFLGYTLFLARAIGAEGSPPAIGKPIVLKFTAVDGQEVDLANMKGKVVLVDFWATWCAPCLRELPHVRAAYTKLHPKGFEIIGVSLDDQKNALLKLVKKEKLPWPQYFDGLGVDNKIATRFGVESIPTMWLIDKKGNIRDLDAGRNLLQKVEKLLAEK